MTNELEKQFFDTFGIEPRYEDACTVEDKYWNNEELAKEYGTFDQYMNCKCGDQENCTTECSCAYQKEVYPEITDRILLELICKLSGVCWPHFSFEISVSELKETILKFCIHYKVMLKHQIRTLFEENN